jgi:protein SCO1/2
VSAGRTVVAAALVCAVGLAAASVATDGFQAYTLESARRLHALRSPAPVPNLVLELADGSRARPTEVSGRVLLVDFIYTRCATVCTALGSIYAQLQRRLAPEIAAGEVRLLSITFDSAGDGPAELAAYRGRFSTDAAGWMLGRPAGAGELRGWLDAFGVVVIPDGVGGYVHNAAVHVVGPDRRLVAIFDLQDIDGIVRKAREIVGSSVSHVAAR